MTGTLDLMIEGLYHCRPDGVEPPKEPEADYFRAVLTAVWCLNGFPTIEIGHRLAAALICTVPPAEVRMPWSSFLLLVPRGLIGDLTHVLAGSYQRNILTLYLRFEDNACACARSTIADLQGNLEPIGDFHNDARKALFGRAMACAARLVANICVLLEQSGSHVQRVGKGYALDPFKGSRVAPEPKTQLFRLGAPVKVDCREAVQAFASGARRSTPQVQWIVRGHWTHQPCGPNRSQRRLQWIEPYWKGKEGMPINVRPHVIGDA